MTNLNPETLNGVIILVVASTVIFGGGGILFGLMAFVQIMKARKDDLERAFLAADPKSQAVLLSVATGLQNFLGVFTEFTKTLAQITDGKPNTDEAAISPVSRAMTSMDVIATYPAVTETERAALLDRTQRLQQSLTSSYNVGSETSSG